MPEVPAGSPELAAGAPGLSREVRWAHVVVDSAVAASVDGGEIILMTAAALPTGERQRERFVSGLADAGATAIMLELGRGLTEAPGIVIRACNQHDMPLIVLRREVRFVQITQRVHQRILAAQNEALTARAEVHE